MMLSTLNSALGIGHLEVLACGLFMLSASSAIAQPIVVPYQMNGSAQPFVNNPNHYPGGNNILTLDPSSGFLTLEENVGITLDVNAVHWTTGYAGFASCPEPFYFENSATAWRAFLVDGVLNSIQQPWTATSYNGYADPSLPWGYFYCSPYAGSTYVNYDDVECHGVEATFDLGGKGTLYSYVYGFYAQGSGASTSTASFNLPAYFYLYNVPAFPVCPPTFGSPVSCASGYGLAHAALVDLNGDNRPDMITANYGDHDGSILLNNGDGTFGVANRFGTAAGSPQVVATGDFNQDNHQDFVVGNGSGWVSVFRGDGLGGYTWLDHTATFGISPRAIAVADLDGDTHLDLAIAGDGTAATLAVMWGRGDGTFDAPVQFGSGSLSTIHTGVVVGQFNPGGIPDLAVTNGNDTVSVLMGLGGRSFSVGASYPTGNVPYAIVAADFSGDGQVDLAVANSGSSSVSILLGDGLGGFTGGVDQPVGAAVVAMAVDDLNGDGKPDIVTGNYAGTTMTVLMGRGNGVFYRLPTDLAIGAGVNSSSANIGDLDGDGRLDLATTNATGDGVYTFRQLGLTAAPGITRQPVSTSVCVGGQANFSVFPSSSTSRTYRWRRNGTPLVNGPSVSGATSASLNLFGVPLSNDGGVYDCVVTTACGSTASDPATLWVRTPIVFTRQPESVVACASLPASFSVAVSNAPPLSYQWYRDGVPVTNATSATLTLYNVPSEAGQYTCVVTNACGSVTSNAATIGFCAADFECDGTVDFFDYDAYVNCFEGIACPPGKTADFDGDGSLDFFDYDAFVVAFETPC